MPTLVETKRSNNTEIRRSIVGQMLDYAAFARRTWKVDDIRRAFEEAESDAGRNPNDALSELLQSEGDPDVDDFWQRVETNLRAARMRLLFVADGIPDELAHVVEFLNEQMPGIEVLAVEIKRFKGDTGRTLVPRIVGRTAATQHNRSGNRLRSHTRESFLDTFDDTNIRGAAEQLLNIPLRKQSAFNWGPHRVTIVVRCPAWPKPLPVAWLYEPGYTEGDIKVGGQKVGGFVFGAGTGNPDFFESLPNNVRKILDNWVNQFAKDEFVAEVDGNRHKAWVITHEDAAANIDVLAQRLANVLASLKRLEPEQG